MNLVQILVPPLTIPQKTTRGTQKIFSDKSENAHAAFAAAVSDQRTLSKGKADFANKGSFRPENSYLNR